MRPTPSVFALALPLFACGARSPLAQPPPASVARDAAPDPPDVSAPDVSTPDVPPPDVSVPVPAPSCALRIISGPTVVHEERGGYLTAPALTLRSPYIDALATFIAVDDDRYSEVSARSVTLERDRTLTRGPRSPLSPATSPAHFSASGSQIGGCFRRGDGTATPPLLFSRWFTYTPVGEPLAVLRDESECTGIAHATTPWLLALRNGEGGSPGPRLLTLGGDGVPLGPPRPALTLLAPSSRTRVAVSTLGNGFAWVSSADSSGAIELGTRDGEGVERHALVRGFRGALTPGLSETRGGDAALVAGYDESARLVASAVLPDGTVRFRSPPLTFVMDPDAAPSVTDATFGVVVAALAYGDFDPTRGALEATLLRPDGSPSGEPIRVPIHRVGLPRNGEITAARYRDYVMLHWTGARDAPELVAESYVMVLGCE